MPGGPISSQTGAGPPRSSTGYLVGPVWDATWLVAPGWIGCLLALGLVAWGPERRAGALVVWVGAVLLIDVAHVWSTLFRTYADPIARVRHRTKLWVVPLACVWLGALLHLDSPLTFWRVLAYLAMFHFVKQHEGIASLYARLGAESERARRWARAAVWATTAGPLVYWHASGPRSFDWFVPDERVVELPAWVGSLALLAQIATLAGFACSRVAARAGGRRNPMLVAVVLTPALGWNLGIVWLDDDRAFTLTNVLSHGIPYLALVWLTGGRARVAGWLGRARGATARPVAMPAVVASFLAVIWLLAWAEEWLWDRLVWHERPELFGAEGIELGPLGLSLAVAVLTVPQATHYVLDRYLWRAGPDNPGLAAQLGLGPRGPAGEERAPC